VMGADSRVSTGQYVSNRCGRVWVRVRGACI
jgi:hypothetical protein